MSLAPRARVILVMRQPGNARVLGEAVAEIGMEGVGVSSEAALREALASDTQARSALVDVSGFGQNVWTMCALLQSHDIPFVVLSTSRDAAAGNRTLEYGAASVLQKPVAKSALLSLMRNLEA